MDTTSRLPAGAAADGTRSAAVFRHEALLYSGVDEFAVATSAFVREALAAGEAVMVAVPGDHADRLRDELGVDARAVHFVDMRAVGRNPARIIPAWQAWVDRQRLAGRAFRGVGEPVWAGRSPAELVEYRQHEVLLDAAFGAGPGWWLLCPYDVAALGPQGREQAAQTHPTLVDHARRWVSPVYPAAGLAEAGLLADPLPEPGGAIAYETRYAFDDLPRIRVAVGEHGRLAGMTPAAAADLVLAVNELVTNSVVHGGGVGRLRMWLEDGRLVAEVRDHGRIRDPLIGRRRPVPDGKGGAGIWMVNKLCDLVQIRSSLDRGTTVRIHCAL